MKKILIMIILLSNYLLANDNVLPQYLYIGLLTQYYNSPNISYSHISIIKKTKNGNKIYYSKLKDTPDDELPLTEQGKLLLSEFKELNNINFSKCNFEKLKIINKDPRFPIVLKEIKEYDSKSYRALAILSESLYKNQNGVLVIENYLKQTLNKKDFFCPEYYNGN